MCEHNDKINVTTKMNIVGLKIKCIQYQYLPLVCPIKCLTPFEGDVSHSLRTAAL